jgi:hypothetical protein
MSKGQSFSFDANKVDKLIHSANKIVLRERGLMMKKMNDITNIVWQTAHAKRPMITHAEMKKSGRSKRVSNPNADYGVPVDTGALQISIKKEVTDNGKSIVGSIFVDSNTNNPKSGRSVQEYAKAMEFGTSKIASRSFLRSALHVNKEWIKRRFSQKEATLLGRFGS